MIYSSSQSGQVGMKTGAAFGWKHWKHAELVGQFKSVGGSAKEENLNYKQAKAARRRGDQNENELAENGNCSIMCQVFTSAGLKGYFWKTEKVNYISLFVLLSSFSAPTAPVLILVKIFAQIRESVFNFSKAVVVVNQSRREVCQPGFLAIIGPKLADGPPIL